MTPPAAPERGAGRAVHRARRRQHPIRWHPVLVVVLVVVLATVVALVLAQSAGAIHWSILGGNGSSPPG